MALKTSSLLATSLLCGIQAALAGSAAPSSDCKDDCCKDITKCIDEVNYVQTAQKGLVLSGYVDAGYTYNFVGRNDALPARAYTDDANPRGDFNLYATKLVLEKPLTEENKLQAGFRADIMVGEDAGDLSGGPLTNNSNAFYLQQAYAQFRLPVGRGVDVKVGKWQAIIGYEAEERPLNPNITPGVVSFVDPSWYTGVLFSSNLSDIIDVYFGFGNGSGLDNGMTLDNTDQVVLTGAIGFTAPGNNASTYLGFHYAPVGDSGYDTENEPMADLNWTGTWNPKFANDKLMLAFNTSFATFNDFGNPTPASNDDRSTFFGVALYAKYQLTDLVSLAGRGEYVHTDDSQLFNPYGAFPLPFNAGMNDVWTWTGTVGFDLAENLMLRAEYRIDFGDDVRVNSVTGASQHTAQMIATEVVFSF